MNDWATWHRQLANGVRRGPWAALQRGGLTLLSVPYAGAMQLRNCLYDREWLASSGAGVPVVSVGNLTLGGTGKTPAVEYLARVFRERNVRVAILSRGYGAEAGRNDEALVLEENLPDVPHLQGADRVASAQVAVEELEAELLLLDDGFQHRRLRRDFDLVLLDATNPWGHGRVFPRGLLREPKSGLRRASAVLLTRWDQAATTEREQLRSEASHLLAGKPVLPCRHAPRVLVQAGQADTPIAALRGRPIAAFCGLGNPASFFRSLSDLGARLLQTRVFPDHHAYSRADVDDLVKWARSLPADAWLVTSQKDLVKLRVDQLGPLPLFALKIEMEPLEDPQPLHDALLALLPFSPS